MTKRTLSLLLSLCLLASLCLTIGVTPAAAENVIPAMPKSNTNLATLPQGNNPNAIASWEYPIRMEAHAASTDYVGFDGFTGLTAKDTYVLKATFTVVAQSNGVWSGPEILFRTGSDDTAYKVVFQGNCSYLFKGSANCCATIDHIYAKDTAFAVAIVVSPAGADVYMDGTKILGYDATQDASFTAGTPEFRIYAGGAKVLISDYSAYDATDKSVPPMPEESTNLATGAHPNTEDADHFATWETPLHVFKDCGDNYLCFDGFTGLTNRDSYVLKATFNVTELSQWHTTWSGPEIVFRGNRNDTYYRLTCQSNQSYLERFDETGSKIIENSGIHYVLNKEFKVAIIVTPFKAEIYLNNTKAFTYDGSSDPDYLRAVPQFQIGGQTSMLEYDFEAYDLQERSETITDISGAGGNITIDDPLAQAGDTVTLTVVPNEGHVLKAGSLKILAGNRKIVPTRVGYQDTKTDGIYSFTMPGTGIVKIDAEFVDADSTINFAVLGAQYHTADNDKQDGIRFGFQFRFDTKNGRFNIGDNTYTVQSCGTLVTRRDILEIVKADGTDSNTLTMTADWGANAQYRINIPQTKVLDITDDHIDFAATLIGITSAHYDKIFTARGYVIAADKSGHLTIFYSKVIDYSMTGLLNASTMELSVPTARTMGLSDDLVESSLCHTGNRARLQKTMQKARSGQPITIAFLGGSITDGTNVNVENSYARLVRNWWKTTFPNTEITYINAGIGQTGSVIGVHRVDEDVLAYDPDFVVVEYAVNDGTDQETKEAYDSLLRKIWNAACTPSVLVLHMGRPGGSAQVLHEEIATHYDLPQISYRDAVNYGIDRKYFTWTPLTDDSVHPNVYGYTMCSVFINSYLQSIYEALDTISDVEPTELPAPLTADVYASTSRLGSNTFTPNELGTFTETADASYFLKDGWVSNTSGGAFEFTITAKRITIAYRRDKSIARSKIDVAINDTYTCTIDGQFNDWDGQLVNTLVIANNATAQSTKVSIRQQVGSNGEFVIAAIYVAY